MLFLTTEIANITGSGVWTIKLTDDVRVLESQGARLGRLMTISSTAMDDMLVRRHVYRRASRKLKMMLAESGAILLVTQLVVICYQENVAEA